MRLTSKSVTCPVPTSLIASMTPASNTTTKAPSMQLYWPVTRLIRIVLLQL